MTEDYPAWVLRVVGVLDAVIGIPLMLIGTAYFLGRHALARLRGAPPPDGLPVFLGMPRRR
jgi:hypothetical protein